MEAEKKKNGRQRRKMVGREVKQKAKKAEEECRAGIREHKRKKKEIWHTVTAK